MCVCVCLSVCLCARARACACVCVKQLSSVRRNNDLESTSSDKEKITYIHV